MKVKFGLMSVLAMTAMVLQAAPVRVVILDFEDDTGKAADNRLGGAVNTQVLAKKGAYLMMKQLIGNADFKVVDQRDFMAQMSKMKLKDEGKVSSFKPAYLDAARALNADILLRGALMSFSAGKQKISQGGWNTELANVSMSASVQAQDVADGSVIAMGIGNASQQFRQTAATQTELSEDDVLGLLDRALAKAIPEVTDKVNKKMDELAKRQKITVNFHTTDDPAMVEIDGVLVGSTPIDGMEIYKGEHLLHVSRPGYDSITKRVNLSNNATINVPTLRTDLSAEERKEILKSAELKAYLMDGKPDLVIQEIE